MTDAEVERIDHLIGGAMVSAFARPKNKELRQECWAKVLEKIREFDPGKGQFDSYVFATAKGCIFNVVRKGRKHAAGAGRFSFDDEWDSPAVWPPKLQYEMGDQVEFDDDWYDQLMGAAEILNKSQRAYLNKLDPNTVSIFADYLLSGDGSEVVASRHETKASTVRECTRRILGKLRERISDGT